MCRVLERHYQGLRAASRRSVSKELDGRKWHICEQSYYHWQRKFRQQAYSLIQERAAVPAVPEKTGIAFAEVPCIQQTPKDTESAAPRVTVIRTSRMSVEITNDISYTVLAGILKEVSRA